MDPQVAATLARSVNEEARVSSSDLASDVQGHVIEEDDRPVITSGRSDVDFTVVEVLRPSPRQGELFESDVAVPQHDCVRSTDGKVGGTDSECSPSREHQDGVVLSSHAASLPPWGACGSWC